MAKEKKEIADLIMIEGVDCKGFGVIPKIVTTDTNLSIGAKALYAYLCSYAGNGTTAFPRRDKILARIYYFTVVFLFVFFGEIVVGSIFEQVSGISLWDYSGIPLHVTKYTSIPTCAAMSLGVAVIMGNFFEGLMKKIQRIPYRTTVQLDYVLGTLILVDWLIMMVSINVFKKAPAYWSLQLLSFKDLLALFVK